MRTRIVTTLAIAIGTLGVAATVGGPAVTAAQGIGHSSSGRGTVPVAVPSPNGRSNTAAVSVGTL